VAFADLWSIELLLAAFAGGAFGAAIGALPAFVFTGIMVIAGEASVAAGGPGTITGSIGFGPVFGPHISFAGGAAAVAYAAQTGYADTGFDYHEGKNITAALGTKPDVLAVGGVFGILGHWITTTSATLALPWDPIAVAVVLSAVAHRLAFGYSIIGDVAGDGLFDMSPFERGEMRSDDGDRLATEPWLGHQYKWGYVTMIGLVAGLLGGYLGLVLNSAFMGFGISAATLFFLNLGVAKIPVTHHMTLPASTAALAMFPSAEAVSVSAVPLVIAGVFGIIGALVGEVIQRIFYAHADTHLDPPAAAITIATFLIAVLTIVGVFPRSVWVPLPV
jgi:hypothetical protein